MQKSEYMVLEVCHLLCMLNKTMCFIPNIRCLKADTKGKVMFNLHKRFNSFWDKSERAIVVRLIDYLIT